MGLYDTVITEGMHCPFCGSLLENQDWQTKSFEGGYLNIYSREEAETKFYKTSYWEGAGGCTKCGRFIFLEFQNESEAAKRYRKAENIRWERKMTRTQKSKHPNHDYSIGFSGAGPSIIWMNAWCPLCIKHETPLGIEEKYLLEVHEHAKKRWEEWEYPNLPKN